MPNKKDKLADFRKWCKTHMSVFEAMKQNYICAGSDEEIEEVMAELFFAGEENWDNLMFQDDGK